MHYVIHISKYHISLTIIFKAPPTPNIISKSLADLFAIMSLTQPCCSNQCCQSIFCWVPWISCINKIMTTMANRNIYDAGSKKKKCRYCVKCISQRSLKEKASWFSRPLPPHTSDSGVFLLTGKHILNHQLFSPRQAPFIRSLAHTVNNFHTPFSLHLIKRDLRDPGFTTLQSRQGDMSVNNKGLTDIHLGKEPPFYCSPTISPLTYSKMSPKPIN